MGDHSLREALEKVLATTDGWTVSNETLLGLLRAHPAEPAVDDLAARLRVSVDAAKSRRLGELGRPMPTREQIAAKLSDYVDEGNLSIAVAAIEDLLTGAE